MQTSLNDIVSLAKRRGFIYPGSEIYGGLANTWDYGPLGVELKRKIVNLWWETFISKRSDMIGVDTGVILSSKVWEASGHLNSFNESVADCRNCKNRFRADHLIEDHYEKKNEAVKVEGKGLEELTEIISRESIPCPRCGSSDWTEVRAINQLFPTRLGVLENGSDTVYLRGETAQGIFVNFKNILDSTRAKLPFGVGNIGKSFRNEFTKGQFIFRTVEFEQGEIEYFFHPDKSNWEEIFASWLDQMQKFVQRLGVNTDNIRVREHTDEERSFYSKKTVDLEYNFPFGYKELWGLAYRTDYDLKAHMASSGKELVYTDPESGEKIVPHVIEPAVGIDRLVLMVLCDSYWLDSENNRTVLRLAPELAPSTVAVFPLVKNNLDIVTKARSVYELLTKSFRTYWDDRGNIGKRYFYQDEAGTPFCITIDHDTLTNDEVTIRDRDTMKQERVSVDKLPEFINAKLQPNQ